MKKQVLFKTTISLFLIMFFIGGFMSLHSQENFLENEFFESWIDDDGQPEFWVGSHAFSTNWNKVSNYVLVGNYSIEVSGGAERTLSQENIGEVIPDETYNAEVWVKGTGEAEIGITYPSGHTSWIEEAVTLDNSDWTKISHEATTTDTEGDDGGIRIRTNDDGGDTPEETIYIGAAWLSTQESPGNWPEPLASISVSPDEVYEDESFNETFTLTLTEEEFVVNLDSGDINLGGDFDGLNIADVTRVNNTKATVQLAGNLSHNTCEGNYR